MRDRLLGAVYARLDRLRATGDPADVLSPDALTEIEQLIEEVGDIGEDVEVACAVGWLFWHRFQALPEDEAQVDLWGAIDSFAVVVQGFPDRVPRSVREFYEREPGSWNDQGAELMSEYEQTGDLPALYNATRLFTHAVYATPEDHPDSGMYLSNLGAALLTWYRRTGDGHALDESVATLRAAIAATTVEDPDRARHLSNLGGALGTVYRRTGDTDALRESIDVSREAVSMTPADHPHYATRLSGLSTELRILFERTGVEATLTEAIQTAEAAVASESDPAERASHLLNLGVALLARHTRSGSREALDEAIRAGREARATTGVAMDTRALIGNHLGNALEARFESLGDQDALTEAIDIFRDTVDITPEESTALTMYLGNLGSALFLLFRRTNDLAALREAIAVDRKAIDVTPAGHPSRAPLSTTLANALHDLAAETGELAPLQEATAHARAAVAVMPADHPARYWNLTNLASTLRALSERTEDPDIVEEAVRVAREAVEATPPGHPRTATSLSNLALALQRQAEHTGDGDTHEEALRAFQDAVDATQLDDPGRGSGLNNLATTMFKMHERTGDERVLRAAIQATRDAVAAAATDHPERAMYLVNLGYGLHKLFLETAEPDAATESTVAFTDAASSVNAAPRVRLSAYRGMGHVAMTAGDGASAVAAFQHAVALLPQISPRRLIRSDREYNLGEIAGLGGEAASAAIAAGRPELAVELLEQARGVLLAETMDSYRDLDELRACATDLADRFTGLRDALDAADDVARRGDLAQQWDELLAHVRQIPGLEKFLRPPSFDELRAQAAEGPIVILNVSRYRGDALVLNAATDEPVRVVELPGLTRDEIIHQGNRLHSAVDDATENSITRRLRAQREVEEVLGWLWDAIAEPVLRALGIHRAPDRDRQWPHVWWCPVGELAFLPIHAAGRHGDTSAARTVLDRVVSSYTTTIRALRYARTRQSPSPASPAATALIVAMPETPGASALPGAWAEAETVASLVPDTRVLIGAQATRDAVLDAVPRCAIVHLACHGISDWRTPAESGLLLADHVDRPLTVTAISRLRLAAAELAYLSACSTAVGNQRLADESVHITSAFQLAGFRRVIGTLWPIGDNAAVRIASDIYDHLTRDGRYPPDPHRTAQALHLATRRMRAEYGGMPTAWAGHIHLGV
ncbi:CHAT domain-containing tetratricopeptide repeat protein [Nocardia arizonensis]|uniref:CHAT domain-containing tetratricopeptide repeat protein n=1 Tax=Nocardia arizonensis TaxID=1141647 RepID=UPI0006D143F4|nr:CHAT domain-containing tetratricopeptide repeat protein [Nocardia arizonensis]